MPTEVPPSPPPAILVIPPEGGRSATAFGSHAKFKLEGRHAGNALCLGIAPTGHRGVCPARSAARSRTLRIYVVSSAQLSARTLDEILALCDRAYGENLRAAFRTFADPVHVLATENGSVVSHALWITRWLAPGGRPPLRTAYVEAVATDPGWQGRGFASAVMRALVSEASAFELAALSPSDRGQSLYARLGWEPWTGPLFIREDSGLIETAGEGVMIHRLPGSPPLSPSDPLSAEWRPGELW